MRAHAHTHTQPHARADNCQPTQTIDADAEAGAAADADPKAPAPPPKSWGQHFAIYFSPVLLMSAMIIHAFIEGLTLGMQPEYSATVTIFLALASHKWVAAIGGGRCTDEGVREVGGAQWGGSGRGLGLRTGLTASHQ